VEQAHASASVGEVRVVELWRYPVKSLQGEQLDSVSVSRDGLEGDRRFAIYDLDTGFGLTGRRVPELLFASARLRDDGAAEITLPDGTTAGDDEALSEWLGRPVTLRSAATEAARRYENVVDFEQETASDWTPFDGADGAFHDNPSARVALVSTATVGSKIALGHVTFDVEMRLERCVMTTRAQAGGIERDLDVLRTIARERDACLAVGALVVDPGTLRIGDVLTSI